MTTTVSVDTRQVDVKLGRITQAERSAVRGAIISVTQQLAARVRAKLSGEVLQKRSGRLYDSIQTQLIENPSAIYGVVKSVGVPYAAIHEYGGVTPPHLILPKNAKALAFQLDGRLRFFKAVHHPGSHIPARPYMSSSLAEMRAGIIQRLTAAVQTAAKAA